MKVRCFIGGLHPLDDMPGSGRGQTHSETALVSSRKFMIDLYRAILRGRSFCLCFGAAEFPGRSHEVERRRGTSRQSCRPLPELYRCHSSASRQYDNGFAALAGDGFAGLRPWQRSSTSLNFALAWATVQVLSGHNFRWIMTFMVHCSHLMEEFKITGCVLRIPVCVHLSIGETQMVLRLRSG